MKKLLFVSCLLAACNIALSAGLVGTSLSQGPGNNIPLANLENGVPLMNAVTLKESQIEDIQGFMSDTKALKNVFVDACFLRTNYQTGLSSPLTFKGRTGTLVGSPAWDANGITLNGTSQALRFSLPPSSGAFTVVMVIRESTNALTSTAGYLFTYSTASGLNDTGLAFEYALVDSGGPYGLRYFSSGSSGSEDVYDLNLTGQGGTSVFSRGLYSLDDSQATVAFSYDGNNTLSFCRDGVLPGTHTMTKVPNGKMTELVFGARMNSANTYDKFFNPTIIAWAVYNKVLSQNEEQIVLRALHRQDPQTENILAYGDSLSWNRYYALTNRGWFYMAYGPWGDGQRFAVNPAISGTTVASQYANFSNAVYQWRPGGKIVKSTIAHMGGINDIWTANDSAANIENNISNLCIVSKLNGFTFEASTIAAWSSNDIYKAWGVAYTPSMEATRLAVNDWIVSNQSMFSKLHRRDRMFPNTSTNVGFTLDGGHFNMNGNRIIADEMIWSSKVDDNSEDPYNVILYPKDITLNASAVRDSAGSGGSFGIRDRILISTSAGNMIGYRLPDWATGVVSTVTYVWEGANPLTYTNWMQPAWYNPSISFGAANGVDQTFTVTNGFNTIQQYCFDWPTTNSPRYLDMYYPNARTNTSSLLYIIKWNLRFYGTRNASN